MTTTHPAEPVDRGAALRRRAATASLALACALTSMKLAAAVASGSIALLASLIDSLADLVASAITFLSVRISMQPPDRSHRYGHGKAESLSALAQAALIAGSAVFVLAEAGSTLANPRPLAAQAPAVLVMMFAILATLLLVAYQRRVVRLTGSQAIAADSVHYRADLATNLSVLLTLLAAGWLGWLWLDPVAGLAIAGYLMWSAWSIGKLAVKTLMDHELATAQRQRIAGIIRAHPAVRGLHDLRTREAGTTVFIELHIELDGAMTVHAAHDVTDALEAELGHAFPDAEIIIHQEPAGLEDRRLDHVIAGRVGQRVG